MRRLFWFGLGAAAGASGTVWVERRVRASLEALQPDHLVAVAGRRAREVGRVVAEAIVEGRDAMRQREAELRGLRDGRAAHGTSPAPLRPVRHATGSATVARATRPGSTRAR